MSGAPHPQLERPDTSPEVDADWTPFGQAVEAIIDEFTEPDPMANEPDVNSIV